MSNLPVDDFEVYRYSPSQVLVELSPYLDPVQFIQDHIEWASENGLALSLYADPVISIENNRTYLVRIAIYDYPQVLWDEVYFKQAVSRFSMFMDTIELNGPNDRSVLRLWVACRDPFSIPQDLFLEHRTKLALCFIEIEDWLPDGWDPLDDDAQDDEDPQAALAQHNHAFCFVSRYQRMLTLHRRYLTRIGHGQGAHAHGGNGPPPQQIPPLAA